MLSEIFTHQYFWLSFLPISGVGSITWLLWLDRADEKKEPLGQLCLALVAGGIAAGALIMVSELVSITNTWLQVILEEVVKVIAAIGIIEIFREKFTQVSQGIMYGFAVGIGFAFFENLAYLVEAYDASGFDPAFWLTWQGRLWLSTSLHAVTTAFFGLIYAGAYLYCAVEKHHFLSPLSFLYKRPKLPQLFDILSFHATREHLVFRRKKSGGGHFSHIVVLEGVWLSIVIHGLYNLSLIHNQGWLAVLIAASGLFYLLLKSEHY